MQAGFVHRTWLLPLSSAIEPTTYGLAIQRESDMAMKEITITANAQDGSVLGTCTVLLSNDVDECIGNAVATFEDGSKEVLWNTAKDHHSDAIRQAVIRLQATLRNKARAKRGGKKARGVMSQLG